MADSKLASRRCPRETLDRGTQAVPTGRQIEDAGCALGISFIVMSMLSMETVQVRYSEPIIAPPVRIAILSHSRVFPEVRLANRVPMFGTEGGATWRRSGSLAF